MKYSALLPVLLGLWSLPMKTAHAAPDTSNTAQASAHFRKGVQLYRERSFDAALAEFEKSYQISPDFHLLYNLAQVQLERHDYVAALQRFREYLQSGDGQVNASRRGEVEQEIAHLNELVAEVRFEVTPEGAEVSIDGVSIGSLPLPSPLLMNGGVHRIQLSKPGFTTAQQTLNVTGGDTSRVTSTLQPTPTATPTPTPTSTPAPATPVATQSRKSVDQSRVSAPPPPQRPSHTGIWLTLGTTLALGGASGAMGVLTERTNGNFRRDLDTFGTTKSTLDSERSKLKTYALLTDAFAGAALLSAGLCVYFIASSGSSTESDAASPRVGLGVAPDLRSVYARANF